MKAINRWINKHSVQTSVIAFILVFAVSASIISLAVSKYFMTRFVINGYLTDYLQAVYSDFENNFNLAAEQINMLNVSFTTWQEVYLIMSDKKVAPAEKQKTVSDSFNKLLGREKYSIVDGADIFVDGNVYRYAKVPLDFDAPDDITDKTEPFSLTVYGGKITSGSENYIAMVTKYYNFYNNYSIGYIVFYIKESYFFSLYENSFFDENEFFITSDGRVLSHFEKTKLGSEIYIPEELYSGGKLSVRRYNTSIIGKFKISTDNINSDIEMVTIMNADKLYGIVDRINVYIFTSLAVLLFIAAMTSVIATRRFVRQHLDICRNIKMIEIAPDETVEFETKNELQTLENSFSRMSKRISQLIKQKDKANEAQRIAEMKAMQVHINPHFIYNALDVITCFAKCKGETEIENMTYALASYFRIGLSGGRSLIPIRDEIKHVKSYIDIESIRFPDLFTVEYDIPDYIADNYEIIKITLQPLVENAVKHGFADISYKGHIKISAKEENGDIIFTVADNGCGCDKPPLSDENETVSGGYGLTNVSQRLKFEYGDGYGLEFKENRGGGTVVCVRIAAKKCNDK